MKYENGAGKIAAIASCCLFLFCTGCQSSDGAPEAQAFHEVFGSAPTGLSVPESVTRVAWTWSSPEEAPVLEVIPIPTGAIAHTSSGAFAINTLTGETLWSYGFSESMDDVEPTPDGSQVVISSEQGVAVLDTASGDIIKEEIKKTEKYELSLGELGTPLNSGLASTSSVNEATLLRMEPWRDQANGWEVEILCSGSDPVENSEESLTTQNAFILVLECRSGDQEIVSIDPESGNELWRVSRDRDLELPVDLDLGSTGEVLVHQDISTLRGTLVMDASTGEVVAEDIEDGLHNDLLRILPDGYLAVRDTQDGNLNYEVLDFSGEVVNRTTLSKEEAGDAITGYLPLSGALVKLGPADEERGTLQPILHTWGTEHNGEEITIPIEVTTPETLSLREVDRVLGPGAFEATPGAVILREYSSSEATSTLVGLH